jgi:hypothetical protein
MQGLNIRITYGMSPWDVLAVPGKKAATYITNTDVVLPMEPGKIKFPAHDDYPYILEMETTVVDIPPDRASCTECGDIDQPEYQHHTEEHDPEPEPSDAGKENAFYDGSGERRNSLWKRYLDNLLNLGWTKEQVEEAAKERFTPERQEDYRNWRRQQEPEPSFEDREAQAHYDDMNPPLG